jgi:signal transduction histidine kinase
LNSARPIIESHAQGSEMREFQRALGRYIDGLARLESGSRTGGQVDAESVRLAGSEISSLAKIWVQRERDALHASMRASRWQLAAVLLLAAGLLLLTFWWLAREVLLPLKRMVNRLEPIAAGRYTRLKPRNDALELQTLAQAINHMLEHIEQRERKRAHTERLVALGVLVSGVAHELNNPLGNIASSLDLYNEQQNRPPEQRDALKMERYLRQAREETDRAHRIVRLLLDHARDRAGERLDCVSVDLEKVVESALRWSQVQCRNSEVSVNCREGLFACVAREPLQQALVNLLVNADQSAGPGAKLAVELDRKPLPEWNADGRFSVGPLLQQDRVSPDGRPRTGIAIRVSDSGPGVQPEDMPHLFEPFYRAERHRDTEGSGLGLYLVAQIMEAHGGAVSVENGPGIGAVFTLWLPENHNG